MATSDCATIIKRGYLTDKRLGPLDRKRWYVLRQDLTQGYCLLEFYKDEKSASKGESLKGFINVHDVVEVQRVSDKKQTFEILIPGVGYKLIANSEVETDEWVETLKRLILYRKDNWRVSTYPPLSSLHSNSHISQAQTTHLHHHRPPQSLMIPIRSPATPDHSHSPSRVLHHGLPTPPEGAASPPIFPPFSQRRTSTELAVPPLPSPPSTSSDSSSMCSNSNASFDVQTTPDMDTESGTRFRVHIKESEGLNISGPADLVVADNYILLYSETGQQLMTWPIGSLRRYGVNNVCFTIVAGRYCETGEGRFQFYSPQSRLIHSRVHAMATQRATAKRRGSELTASMESSKSLSQLQKTSHGLNLSPPSTQYTHIEHALRPCTSQEQYNRIQHGSSSIPPVNYDKLNHGITKPISITTQPQMIPHVTMWSPKQFPMIPQNMGGPMMFLSSSPCHTHVVPPPISHTMVTTVLPGTHHQNPPLTRGSSAESSCPDFSGYHRERGRDRLRSRSVTSPTLL